MVFVYLVTLASRDLRSRFISPRIYGYKFGWCSSSRTNSPPPPIPISKGTTLKSSLLVFRVSFLVSLSCFMEGRERGPGDKVFVARWRRFTVKPQISRPLSVPSKLLTSRNGPVIARQSLSGLYEFFTPPSVTSLCHFRCVALTEVLQSCWSKSTMV